MLNERIKSLRLDRNWSQVDLAKMLHVTKQSVSNWENDNIQPSIEMLMKIAGLFSVSTDYLLGLEQKKQLDLSGLTIAQQESLYNLVSAMRQPYEPVE